MDGQTKPSIDVVSFAKPILINMENRPERLRDTLAELSQVVGRAVLAGDDIHIVRPRVFDEPGGFRNCGFRSNLDAHLQAVLWARSADLERVLVLEDDVSFGPTWPEHGPALLEQLDSRRWQLATLGYLDVWKEAPGPEAVRDLGLDSPTWLEFSDRVNGAHAYFVHHSGFDRWISHLEAVASGTPGDDLTGPMASDGAINTFSWVNPETVRLLAVPNMVGTRPTRSDITPSAVDRLPVLGHLAERVRSIRRRYGPKVTNFE